MPTKRETIIHNVGDEPITVQQTDGSELTVPPGTSLPADLPSEADAFGERDEDHYNRRPRYAVGSPSRIR